MRRAETWSQEAYIKASTVNPNDLFGYSIALSGDTLAVGAQAEAGGDGGVDGDESDNSAPASGAVFVFARTGTTWCQQGYIKASHPDIGDLYATTVALDGDHLAVGAIAEDGAGPDLLGDPADNSAQASGAVYLYQRTGDRWHPQAYIKAPLCDTSDFLGSAVSLHDGTLAMGARNEASGDPGSMRTPGTTAPRTAAPSTCVATPRTPSTEREQPSSRRAFGQSDAPATKPPDSLRSTSVP